MKFDIDDHSLGKVKDHTYWIDLDNYDQTLDTKTGVFIFASANHHVRYIGKAEPGNMLSAVRGAKDAGKDWQATLVKALYTGSTEATRSLKKGLKMKYQPLNNDNIG